MQIDVTRESTASPEEVWAIMTDLDRSAEVLSTVTRVERLDGGSDFGVGTRWRETRELFGREATEELEVTAIDELSRSYVVEADNRGTHYVSTMGVERTAVGSRLRMSLGSEPGGRAGRLLARTIGRAFEGATRKALEQDLADIAETAERGSDGGSGEARG